MANGHGDFGWMYGRIGEKNWGKVSEWDVPWLMSILEIKKSDHVLVPTKEYDCPPHIKHDLLRESQLSLLLRQERNEHADSRKWKLKAILASCLAVERLEIEERAIGSPPLPAAAKLKLPRPLLVDSGPHIFAGFKLKGENRHMSSHVDDAVFFDYERWSVGLLIHYAKPQMVKWGLRTILVQMRTVQLTRNERDRDKDVDVYGIVTSRDLIQFHRLNAASELQSSPVLLLTSQGLPTIWSYLRDIIHAIQVKAPPPLGPEKWGCEPDDPIFRVERTLLTYRWGRNPDGTPYEKPKGELAAKVAWYRRQYIMHVSDPGDAESTVLDHQDSSSDEEEKQKPYETKPHPWPRNEGRHHTPKVDYGWDPHDDGANWDDDESSEGD